MLWPSPRHQLASKILGLEQRTIQLGHKPEGVIIRLFVSLSCNVEKPIHSSLKSLVLDLDEIACNTRLDSIDSLIPQLHRLGGECHIFIQRVADQFSDP